MLAHSLSLMEIRISIRSIIVFISLGFLLLNNKLYNCCKNFWNTLYLGIMKEEQNNPNPSIKKMNQQNNHPVGIKCVKDLKQQ